MKRRTFVKTVLGGLGAWFVGDKVLGKKPEINQWTSGPHDFSDKGYEKYRRRNVGSVLCYDGSEISWKSMDDLRSDYRFGIDPSYGKDKAMMCISSTDQFGKQKLEFIELQT